jgi:hypothetical protein
LVWLVKIRPEPFAQLSRLLDKISAEDTLESVNKYELAIRVLSKQVSVMRRQIRRFRKEMDQSEQQFDEIWKVISHALNVPSDAPNSRTRVTSGREPPDWSVVEDETDDHELTSASLSGYDYDSASDI